MMEPERFGTAAEVREYYESRYRQGYMDVWDRRKIGMIHDVLGRLSLPEKVRVLDFGCGTGFFSRLLKDIFPAWEVVGADISPAAVEKARQRAENAVTFFVFNSEEEREYFGKFDLLFSHHVIEHVLELNGAARNMSLFLKPNGLMVHVLPCANPGSFEYSICSSYPDGIDPSRGNRFFCEDPGHLRRMSTEDMAALFQPEGFHIIKEFYANQFWGALYWITEANPKTIKELFDPHRESRQPIKIRMWRGICLIIFFARYPVRMAIADKLASLPRLSFSGRLRMLVISIIGLLALGPALVVDRTLEALAHREWKRRYEDRRGSEMALVFARSPAPSPP